MRTAAGAGVCPHSALEADLPLPSHDGGLLEAECRHLLALPLLADRDGQDPIKLFHKPHSVLIDL